MGLGIFLKFYHVGVLKASLSKQNQDEGCKDLFTVLVGLIVKFLRGFGESKLFLKIFFLKVNVDLGIRGWEMNF